MDLSDLDRMPVISSCLKEALRLAPPASIIEVETVDPFVIPKNDGEWKGSDKKDDDHDVNENDGDSIGKYQLNAVDHHSADDASTVVVPCGLRQAGRVIPPGTVVDISLYALHRNPLLWSNAEQFLPSRWMAKTNETTTPFAFIPFSMGSRNCIGQVRYSCFFFGRQGQGDVDGQWILINIMF